MNIKITEKEHLRLQEWKATEYVFGSCFYGKPLDKEDVNSYFYQSLDSPHIEIVGNIHQNKMEEFI